MAAVNAQKPVAIEPRLDFPDCKRTKQLRVTVKDVRVMCAGMDCDDVIHGQEMGRAVSLKWQMARKAARRSAKSPERGICPPPQLGIILSFRSGLGLGGHNRFRRNSRGEVDGIWQGA